MKERASSAYVDESNSIRFKKKCRKGNKNMIKKGKNDKDHIKRKDKKEIKRRSLILSTTFCAAFRNALVSASCL